MTTATAQTETTEAAEAEAGKGNGKGKAPAKRTAAKRAARPTGGTAPKGTSAGNGGKGKGKAPKAPKLTPRETAALRRAEAEGKARALREARDRLAALPERTMPASVRVEHEHAVREAQTESDLAYSAAVLALLALPSAMLADTDRRYVTDHGTSVIAAMTSAAGRQTEAEAAHKGTGEALTSARHVAAERTRDTAVFLWKVVDVHKLMSQGAAAKRYGLTQPTVSRYVLTGRTLARFDLTTKAPSKAVTIHQAAGEKRAELQAALSQDGATFDSVREAVGSVPSRTRREAAQAEAESVPVEAAKLAAKLTNALHVMGETGDTFADLAESTGEEIARALLLAIHAYTRRTDLTLTEAHRKVLVS